MSNARVDVSVCFVEAGKNAPQGSPKEVFLELSLKGKGVAQGNKGGGRISGARKVPKAKRGTLL